MTTKITKNAKKQELLLKLANLDEQIQTLSKRQQLDHSGHERSLTDPSPPTAQQISINNGPITNRIYTDLISKQTQRIQQLETENQKLYHELEDVIYLNEEYERALAQKSQDRDSLYVTITNLDQKNIKLEKKYAEQQQLLKSLQDKIIMLESKNVEQAVEIEKKKMQPSNCS